MSKRNIKCPICSKGDEVIPIIYGNPREHIMEKAYEGEVLLGGCVFSDEDPKWYCKRDDFRF